VSKWSNLFNWINDNHLCTLLILKLDDLIEILTTYTSTLFIMVIIVNACYEI